MAIIYKLNTEIIECRPNCGACCIALSISSPIPGMPEGKPAGVQCVQLNSDMSCKIFDQPERPAVCQNLQPQKDMCKDTKEQATIYINWLEEQTR